MQIKKECVPDGLYSYPPYPTHPRQTVYSQHLLHFSFSSLLFMFFSFFFPFCRLHFAIRLPLCQQSPNIIALHFCETCFTPSLFGCLPILITLQSLNVYMCPSLLLPCCPSLPPSISSLIFINHFISLLSDPLFLST